MPRVIWGILLYLGMAKFAIASLAITQLEPMVFEPTVGGAKTVVYLQPTTSTNGVFLFRISGDPNKKIQVRVDGKDFKMLNGQTGKTVVVKRFKYGCGLNKKGRIRLDGQGQSGVLCIGARAVVKSSSQSGHFSVVVPITVKYL
ncbi:hypothetical protein VINI7043_18671 [Vibrio nigripulchritudo ATCC 27043]|uniref:DUF4402 domain-containing protein n=2 Tax=Vibrio nigripulchritudo TaxID=28173 RepID=U4JV33_9VIBR|nr:MULTISPECIES: DUF4402 domain-containing protein [Vibrio]EGU52082.1 hypothetical protein VINI7043_18671 [Vibrio nigripulchritudo ATCC 27043]KJY80440.1 hypothetical protein TW74_04745 [Vibrio nigripulchritudo]UAB71082.1 hypothetical protein INR79_04025 [Vibrio sp. SCSIO 43132]CCN35668.1 hypothetical protein VIBNIAM115_1910005 [Vibrio nigripulchritudo AM115]CCN44399.1 hypothetical protein VIBNIFTn2_770005 [Vibrio nigripulchritudo FTn2]